ncbi:hypothetical protein N7463_001605 [Penicillium fimorum]|uniref:GPI inositol-deacylase n=1 Tax=Penicillium fimorum TaxID=1882269 RepID=A0A9W9XXT1_9EURO|nr:hypothetical protein N7463_001605 [Penicillium fimorum]
MWRNVYTAGLIVPFIAAIVYDLLIRGIPSPTNPAQVHKEPLGFVPVGNYTQLQDSNGIDVVFVHGLGSNPDTTWQARKAIQGDPSEANVNWVSEFLPDDLLQFDGGNIHLYFFNFDSFWKRDAVQVRLVTIGNDLLEHMANGIRRSQESKNRKLVLVGYSYGGLVIKEAIVLARGNPNFEYMSQSTKAIVFLGTPHRGSSFSSWGRRIAGLLGLVGSNPSILAEIEYDSTMLLDLHTGFEASIGAETQIINVFEQRPTLLFSLWFFRWREFCVREQSAKFGGGRVRNIGLPVDHRGLNKFASRDSSYQVLLSILSNAISPQSRKSPRSQDTKDEFRITPQLPILRNDRFTGRTDLLQRVHRYFKKECAPSQQCVFALHGPGGIGKTQIAVEYAYKYMDSYTSVFWIDGSSEAAILRSFTHAAGQVMKHFRKTHTNDTEYERFTATFGGEIFVAGTGSGVEKMSQAMRGVLDWMSQQENHQWLLIFDNVDDLDSFDIRNNMPKVTFGSILLTSRRTDISGYWKSISVGEMGKEEGKSLFAKSSGFYGEFKDTVAEELLDLLGYFPLAIEQAGAYLSVQQNFIPEQPEQFTRAVQKYIEQYHINAERLLAHKRPQSIWDYRNDTILTTWEVSLEAIQRNSPEAAELLFLCGFLSNNDISEDMLSDDVHLQTNKNSITELFHLLASFSLIRFTSSMNAITIHPLIHYWLRQRLPLQRKQELSERALLLLSRTLRLKYPDGYLGTYGCDTNRLGPHIHAALTNARSFLSKAPTSASMDLRYPPEYVTRSCGISFIYETPRWWYLWLLGQLQQADLFFKSLFWEDEQLEDDPWLLTYKLTVALRDYDGWAAVQFFRWELSEIYMRLHPMHPRSLSIAGDLAWGLYNVYHFEESRRWYEWILTARRRVLGHGHYATMGALIGLAALYEERGDLEKALELRLAAYKGRVARLGQYNVLTLNAAEKVASHYFDHERYEEADQWYRKVLKAKAGIYGPNHESVLRRVRRYLADFTSRAILDKKAQWANIEFQTLNSTLGSTHKETMDSGFRMAMIYHDHNQHAQAFEWLLMTFDVRNRTLGLTHRDTMDTMQNIGFVLRDLYRLDESIKWHYMAYEARNRTLGPDNEDSLYTADSIGHGYFRQSRFDKALEWWSIAFEGRNRTLGPDAQNTLANALNIGVIYDRQSQLDKALEWYSIVFESQNRTLGPDDAFTLQTAHAIGGIFDNHSQFDKALGWYSIIFEGRNRTLGPDDKDTLASTFRLGAVYYAQSQLDKALQWWSIAFEGRSRTLGPDDEDSLYTAYNIGLVYYRQSQFDKALEWWSITFEGQSRTLGLDDAFTLQTAHMIGGLFYDQSQFDKALGWYSIAFEGQNRTLGPDDQSTLANALNIGTMYERQSQLDKALEWYSIGYEGRNRTLGPDDKDTLASTFRLGAVYYAQSQLDKALQWWSIAFEGRSRTLGPDDEDSLYTAHNVGLVYYRQSRFDKALEWWSIAFEGQSRTLGPDDASTLQTAYRIGAVYYARSQFNKALEWYSIAFEGRSRTLGLGDEDTLASAHGIGTIYYGQSQFDKALEWFSIAFEGRSRTLGLDDKYTLASAHGIGVIYCDQSQFDIALDWFSIAFEGRSRTLGLDDKDTLASAHNIGVIYYGQSQFDKALEWYSIAFEGRSRTLGPGDEATLASAYDIGVVYDHQFQSDRALEWWSIVFEGRSIYYLTAGS